ncbi:hypothetical protein PINS_up011174 [Pythium insidiosum]|nr:hypothetical protein PINS_up011174 [Pythium insidiosum]
MAEQYLGVDHAITTTIRNSYLAAKRTIAAKRTSARHQQQQQQQQLKSPQRLLSSPRGSGGVASSLRSPTPLRDRARELPSPRTIIAETLARGKTLPPLETKTPRRSAEGLSPEDPFFSPRFRFDAGGGTGKLSRATAPAKETREEEERAMEPRAEERADDGGADDGKTAPIAALSLVDVNKQHEETTVKAEDSALSMAAAEAIAPESEDALVRDEAQETTNFAMNVAPDEPVVPVEAEEMAMERLLTEENGEIKQEESFSTHESAAQQTIVSWETQPTTSSTEVHTYDASNSIESEATAGSREENDSEKPQDTTVESMESCQSTEMQQEEVSSVVLETLEPVTTEAQESHVTEWPLQQLQHEDATQLVDHPAASDGVVEEVEAEAVAVASQEHAQSLVSPSEAPSPSWNPPDEGVVHQTESATEWHPPEEDARAEATTTAEWHDDHVNESAAAHEEASWEKKTLSAGEWHQHVEPSTATEEQYSNGEDAVPTEWHDAAVYEQQATVEELHQEAVAEQSAEWNEQQWTASHVEPAASHEEHEYHEPTHGVYEEYHQGYEAQEVHHEPAHAQDGDQYQAYLEPTHEEYHELQHGEEPKHHEYYQGHAELRHGEPTYDECHEQRLEAHEGHDEYQAHQAPAAQEEYVEQHAYEDQAELS